MGGPGSRRRQRVSAVQLLALKDRLVFCADTMVNIDPSAEELAEIAVLAADAAFMFGIEPARERG